MRSLPLLLTLLCAGCLAPGAQVEQRPVIGFHAAIANAFEVDQDLPADLPPGIVGIREDVDYTSFELSAGVTTYQFIAPPVDAAGRPLVDGPSFRRKASRLEARIGYSDFEDSNGTELQALELTAGGRVFSPVNAGVAPWIGAGPTITLFEEATGSSIGAQLGLRGGVGVEVDLNGWSALDLGVDYTLPLVAIGPGEVLGEEVDTEFEGLAVRLGLLVTF